jgi:hypothetical protein
VPIVRRTPGECYQTFLDHIRPLVGKVITTHPLICIRIANDDHRRTLEFADAKAVPLETRHGRLYFYMAQQLGVEPEGKQHRLVTQQYWYRLQEQPTGQAVIRWEYDKETRADRHARHHVQIQGKAPIQGGHLDLNKLHTPTGWVTTEEVARFLIHDLGVTPPAGDTWPAVLMESERAFYEDFTGKRYRGPDESSSKPSKP